MSLARHGVVAPCPGRGSAVGAVLPQLLWADPPILQGIPASACAERTPVDDDAEAAGIGCRRPSMGGRGSLTCPISASPDQLPVSARRTLSEVGT